MAVLKKNETDKNSKDYISPLPKPADLSGSKQITGVFKLPWQAVAAVLVMLTTLFLYTNGNLLLPVAGISIIVSHFINARMPAKSWARWVLRIVCYGILFSSAGGDNGIRLFDPQFVGAVGCMWAIEIAIQCWREKPAGNPPGSSIILLSSLSMISAITLGEDTQIGWLSGQFVIYLVAIFIVLTVLSFRSYEKEAKRIMPEQGDAQTRININAQPFSTKGHQQTREDIRIRRIHRSIQVFSLIAALIVGYLFWLPIHIYRDKLTTWGDSLFVNRKLPEPMGLSTSPMLSDTYGGEGSPSRVLRITNYDGDPHLRGVSFDTYKYGSWSPDAEKRVYSVATDLQLHSFDKGKRAHVSCFTPQLKYFLTPLNVAGIAPSPEDQIEASSISGPAIRLTTPSEFSYDIIQSSNDYNQGILCTPPSLEYRSKCLDVPSDIDPSVKSLALQLTAGKKTEPEKLAAIVSYFMSNFSYSLKMHSGPGDRVSDFILNKRAAHCEYFASGAVILSRCVGIPARYVTGYYAHENEGDSLVVRQRDSHAWAECWVNGIGWVTVDATPGGGLPSSLYKNTPAGLRLWEWITDHVLFIREYLSHYTPLQISLAIVLFSLLFFLPRLLLSLLKNKKPASSTLVLYTINDADLVDLSNRFNRYLLATGKPCPINTTWNEHLNNIMHEEKIQEQIDNNVKLPLINLDNAKAFVRYYNSVRFRKGNRSVLIEAQNILELLETETGDKK